MSCNDRTPHAECTHSGSSGVPFPIGGPVCRDHWRALKDFETCRQFFSRHLNFDPRRRTWPFVTLHDHATKHKEIHSIRKLYQKGKILAIFREGQSRYHCLVKLSKNFYGDYIIARRLDGSWHEVSGFEVGVEWEDVITWLQRKGNVQPHYTGLPV